MNSNTPDNGAQTLSRTALVQAIHDPDFRHRVRRLDEGALAEMGYRAPDDEVEFKVLTSTRDTFYLALGDMSEGEQIASEDLGRIQAAGSTPNLGCASCVGSASTISCLCTTAGSIGTAGSAGTASTRD